MKKPSGLTIAAICIGVLVVGAFVYVILTSAQPSPPREGDQSQPDPEPAAPAQTEAAQVPGTYIGYSDAAFASTQANRRLLFFHAGWCPQCRALEKSIQQNGVPENMAIFKVDYDTASGLKQKYGVTIQTTIVEVDPSGNLIRKHVAYDDPSLPAVLNALK